MAGDQLEAATAAFQRMSNEGDTYVGVPKLQPMVSNLTDGGDRAVVLDCIDYDDSFGTFNSANERSWPATPAPKPMVFELKRSGGSWFVTERDEGHDACYDASYALEVLG